MARPALPLLILLFLAIPVATPPAAAQTARIEFEARYWLSDLGGQVLVREGGIGTLVDLERTLGIQDEETWELRATLRPIRTLVLRAGYLPLSYGGSARVNETVEFGGRVFTIDTRVDSDFEIEYGRAGIAWQFLSLPGGLFRLGPLVEIKGLRGDAALAAPELPVRIAASEDFEAAFASAGLLLDAEPTDRLHLFAEASHSVAIDEGDLLDFELGVKYLVLQNLTLYGGYRSLQVDAEEDDDRLDIDFDGLFFGAGLRF